MLGPLQSALQRFARWLDRPLFPWKRLIVSFSISQYIFETYLAYRQYGVLCNRKRPRALENEVDQQTFDKSQAYGRAKAKFGFISGLFDQIKHILTIWYLYPWAWSLAGTWVARYAPARFSGEITQSLVLMYALSFVETILGLPFSYYFHFVLEEKFGFNKQTVTLWITDMLKSQALALGLGIPIGSAFLAIVQKTGDNFFLWLWVFALVVQIFVVTIYPIFIVPIFNKLTPLEPGALKERVEALARKLRFPLTELQVIDGSKRSAHSNAYFAGLPWKKKIVIYDTLIEKSETEEVVAVLAHELGHWKMGHTTKMLAVAQFHLFYMFALFSVFINNRSMYADFGFLREKPIIIGFILFNEVLAPTDSVIKLLNHIISRKFEYEADAFGARLGYATELAKSLIKLQKQNLSAFHTDWMYSTYHHSHPVLTERLSALGYVSKEKVAADEVKNDAIDVTKVSPREL